jgi:small-conductance mechanosensitive channel
MTPVKLFFKLVFNGSKVLKPLKTNENVISQRFLFVNHGSTSPAKCRHRTTKSAQSLSNQELLFRTIRCWSIIIGLLLVAQLRAQDAFPSWDARQELGALNEGTNPEPAVLIFRDQRLAEFRTALFGITPDERVKSAQGRIQRFVSRKGPGLVAMVKDPQAILITVDGRGVFAITPNDLDPLDGRTIEEAATNAVQTLQRAVSEYKAESSLRGVILSIASAGVATALLVLLFWGISRGGNWATLRLAHFATQSAMRISNSPGAAYRRTFAELSRRAIFALSWVLRLSLLVVGITFVLEQFPLTFSLGEYFKNYLLLAGGSLIRGTIRTLPDLLVVSVIFYGTWFAIQLFRLLFNSIAENRIQLKWLDADAAQTTQRIVQVLMWLGALVMAYPYLPGSGSQAFKSISVFAGLVLSLGSSSVMNQIASGLLLVYSRALKPGEYVRNGETEGTVISIGLISTRVRSIKNELVQIPNAVLLSSTTLNFSRNPSGSGIILHTTVTIGYNTPWRQVHELLKRATAGVKGLMQEPEPFVLQTALSDFYVAYQLNVRLENPADRVEVLAALHARIQDIFNEYGVQIMSPHYLTDPAKPAVVLKQNWFAPPAPVPAENPEADSNNPPPKTP